MWIVAEGGIPPLLVQSLNEGKEMKPRRRAWPGWQAWCALFLGSIQGPTADEGREEAGEQ